MQNSSRKSYKLLLLESDTSPRLGAQWARARSWGAAAVDSRPGRAAQAQASLFTEFLVWTVSLRAYHLTLTVKEAL